MRTKEYFLEELSKRWDSPIARNLKRGFLGNELLHFGANVLELNDLGYFTLYRESFPQTASLKGLSLQSFYVKASFDQFRPPYVKIKVDFSTNPNFKNLIIEPFYLQASVGNIYYYNIANVFPNKDGHAVVYMFQGRATTLYNNKPTKVTVAPFSLEQPSKFDFYKVVESLEVAKYYAKLPKTAMSDSVIVTDNEVVYPDQFNNIYNAEIQKSRFVVRSEDLSLNVFIVSPDMAIDFRVSYLDVSFLKRQNQELTLVDYQGNEYQYDIISEFDGLEIDEPHARFTMLKNLSNKAAVATKAQIESFVKSYPDIVDAKCTSAQGNLVQIAVKPINIADKHFDEIVAELYQFGEVITNYEVYAGTPVFFDVIISGEYTNSTVQWLDDRLSYIKLQLNDTTTIATLVQELKLVAPKAMLEFRLSIDVNGTIEQIFSKVKQNSVQIYKQNKLIAWDYYGFVYGTLNTENPVFTNIFPIGDDFVASDDSFSYVYTSDFSYKAKYYPNQMPLQKVTNFLRKDDKVLLQFDNNKIAIYQDYQFRGNTNIAKTLLGTVSPFIPSTGGTITATMSDNKPFLQGLIWLDNGFFRVEDISSSWDTAIYQFNPTKTQVYKTDLWSYTLGNAGAAFGSVTLHDNILMIILISNKGNSNEEPKIFIKNINNTNPISTGFIHPITTTIGNTKVRDVFTDDITLLSAANGNKLDIYAMSKILFAGDNANPTSDIKKVFTTEENETVRYLTAKRAKDGGIVLATSTNRIIHIVEDTVKVITQTDFLPYLQNLGSIDYGTGVVNIDKSLNIDKVEAGIEGTVTDRNSAYPVLKSIIQL